MSNNKKETKGNKKTYIIFAIVVICSMVIGFFSAFLIDFISSLFGPVDKQGVIDTLSMIMPWVFTGLEAVLFVGSVLHLAKTKKLIKGWDEEDEDTIDKIEARLNIPLLLSNLGMILGMFMFGLCIFLDVQATKAYTWFVLILVAFVFTMAWVIGVQAATVNTEKKLNPEKQGDVFDFKFVKKWENSMDEAEKKTQNQAGNAAFKAGSGVCLALWLVCLFGILMFNTGVFPLFCVCLIWLVMSLTYVFTCMKIGNRKK